MKKSTRKYYAQQNPRGFGNEINIHLFSSQKDRDEWVAAHKNDGDCNSAACGAKIISAKEAYSLRQWKGNVTERAYILSIEHE